MLKDSPEAHQVGCSFPRLHLLVLEYERVLSCHRAASCLATC